MRLGRDKGFEGNCSRVWSCYSISLCFSLIIHMLCSAKDEYNGCFWMSIFWSLMWLVGVSKLYPFLSSFCCFLFGPTLTCTAIKLASYHWHASTNKSRARLQMGEKHPYSLPCYIDLAFGTVTVEFLCMYWLLNLLDAIKPSSSMIFCMLPTFCILNTVPFLKTLP